MRDRGLVARAVAGTLLWSRPPRRVAALALALGLGEREPLEVRVARITSEAERSRPTPRPTRSPGSGSRRGEFEAGAATAASHVIYEMSPGRRGRLGAPDRGLPGGEIEAAAERHGLDPDMLEAVIFLESAGRPEVIAGPTPESAAGLAQILPSTATDLLGMSVDLAQSIALTRAISRSGSPGETDRLAGAAGGDRPALRPRRRDRGRRPLPRARPRAVRRRRARGRLLPHGNRQPGERAARLRQAGDEDADRRAGRRARAQLPGGLLRLGPRLPRDAYELLSGFGDESADYLWKVLASEQILRLYREDPDRLAGTAELATNKATLEEVFHPENETDGLRLPG